MILAELNVRHTRRHMPTRRVALGDTYLPTCGTAYGVVLLGAVVAEFVDGLDEEQRDTLPRLLDDARKGRLSVPRIALRHRLQTDIHGLDRSRHRILERERARRVLELDVHGWPDAAGAGRGDGGLGPAGGGEAPGAARDRCGRARARARCPRG